MNKVEIVFGLVAPIGTDLEAVIRHLEDFLQGVNYRSKMLHLSKDFKLSEVETRDLDGAGRYSRLMDIGDELRRNAGRDDAVAISAVRGIKEFRDGDNEDGSGAIAVVVRQFKTPGEIDSLRKIYGNRLVVLSCHSAHSKRVHSLSKRLADMSNEIQASNFRDGAEGLINRDEHDRDSKWGQSVRKTFPMADMFVAIDDRDSLRNGLERMLEILFGHPHHTPTRDEYAMYLAEAAALRSAALGRQVGAVIATIEGDVISVGCNEVPKSRGGLYWEGDSPDLRDYALTYDTNDRCKEKLLCEVLKRLMQANWIAEEVAAKGLENAVEELLYSAGTGLLAGTQIDSIIEFGRCVHAEMAAIVDAARRGVAVNGGVLYTTTFPCHECARHIVAACIVRVVYRLPYPKSLVRDLYPDSIDIDGGFGENSKVVFEPFVGIAPRRYSQFFTMGKRKNERGEVVKWSPREAKPNLGEYFPEHELVKKDEDEFLNEFYKMVEQQDDVT